MSTFAKRLPVFVLVGVMLIMIGSSLGRSSFAQEPTPDPAATDPVMLPNATTPTEVATEAAPSDAGGGLPAQQPIIIGNLNGITVEGIPGSFCWPQAEAATPQCAFVDDPQPTIPINVVNGDAIVFSTEPASPAPITFIATLLDDKNADDEPLEINLSTLGGIFTVNELTEGSHRLQVDALYNSDAPNQPFVSMVYLLQVGGGSVPTDVVPTDAGVPTDAAATDAGTGPTPTFDLFGNGSQATATVETPIAPAETATDIVPTEAATEVATDIATEIPTEVVPVDITPTATTDPALPVTETPTSVTTTEGATALPPTETIVPTVVVETLELPTFTPSPLPLPTFTEVVPPTATPIAVIDPTVPPPPTQGVAVAGTSISVTIPVPQAKIIVGGRTFDPVAVNACSGTPTTQYVCVTQPLNVAVPRVFSGPGDAAQVTFTGPRPTSITVSVLSSDGSQVIGTAQIRPDNLILINLPPVIGNYVVTVEFVYPDGKATYFFRLGIGT